VAPAAAPSPKDDALMAYSPLLVQPMRDEVTRLGVVELTTPEAVDAFFTETPGPALIFVNSVCGCAAGNARPALLLAVQDPACPAHRATVFAGQDPEPTARVRELAGDLPPTSPCFFVLQDGEVTTYVPRQQIEGHTAADIAARLIAAFPQPKD
jgi:putative YphP/YqiW family bacilliredoxin